MGEKVWVVMRYMGYDEDFDKVFRKKEDAIEYAKNYDWKTIKKTPTPRVYDRGDSVEVKWDKRDYRFMIIKPVKLR